MHHVISLDGSDWQVQGWVPYEWDLVGPVRVTTGNLDLSEVLHGEIAPIPATVPGCTHADCLRAGVIEDPYWEFNSRLCEWISQRMWVYRRALPVPASARGGRVRLRFEGIDDSARVFVNGTLVGRHEGQFVPVVFDITAQVNFGGENVLQVIVDPAPASVAQVGQTRAVRTLKPRFAYKWDFTTRLIPVGISDSVTMHITGPAAIDEFWVHGAPRDAGVSPALCDPLPTSLEDAQTSSSSPSDAGKMPAGREGETPSPRYDALARVSATIDAAFAGPVRLEAELFFQGKSVAKRTETALLSAGTNQFSRTLPVPDAKFWWPAGMGEQPIYTARLRILAADNTAADERETTFGIRRVEMLPNDTDGWLKDANNTTETIRPFTLAVNGRKMFIKGYNWVPIEQQYATATEEKYRWLIELALRANVNMLRVWGGGLIEKEVFYRLCDEMGMLVWQEMPQSSSGIGNDPATDKEFCDLLEHTATSAIRRRGGHPSLVFWGGGNELTAAGLKPLDETHPALAAIGRAVVAEHPNLLYIPTSPLGPSFDFAQANVGTGVHQDIHGPWKYLGANFHYEYFNDNDCLFHAETGADGCASLPSMRKIGREELLWPPVKSNRFWVHHAAWWILGEQIQGLVGPIGDIDTFVRVSQALQGEALRYAIESDRRRAWQCSGVALWQLTEPWPNLSCTANVDYYGVPKQAFYVVGRANRPLHVSLRHEGAWVKPGGELVGQVFVHNEGPSAVEGVVTWRVLDASGVAMCECGAACDCGPTCDCGPACRVTVEAGEVAVACPVRVAIPASPQGPLFVEVVFTPADGGVGAGGEPVKNLYAFSPAAADQPPLSAWMALPKTTLAGSVRHTAPGLAEITVRNTGTTIAWLLRVESADGTAVFCDANAESLWPGEAVTRPVQWRQPTDAPLTFSAFNAEEVVLA